MLIKNLLKKVVDETRSNNESESEKEKGSREGLKKIMLIRKG